MTLTTLPTRTAGSLGTTKSNARSVRVASEWVAAAEWNASADALVDVCAEVLNGLRARQVIDADAAITGTVVYVAGLSGNCTATLPTPVSGKTTALVIYVESTTYSAYLSAPTASINDAAVGDPYAFPFVLTGGGYRLYLALGFTTGDTDYWNVAPLPDPYDMLGIARSTVVSTVKTANYALSDLERWALFDTTSGALTATAPSSYSGREFTVSKTNTGTNSLSVDSADGTFFQGVAGPYVCPGSTSAATGSWTFRSFNDDSWWLVSKV